MQELQKILVCSDLSEYSKEIMEYGVVIARGLMTEIIVLNVLNSRDIDLVYDISTNFPERINAKDYVERAREDRYRLLQKMIHNHFQADKKKIRTIIAAGTPFRVILQTVEDEHIDLVVIGNKGRGNVVGTLLGSTAEKVFRHCQVPVLSIRKNEHSSR